MVRLTAELIARGTSGFTIKRKRDESTPHYLKRLTHLYLEDRGIDEIGDELSMCRNLIVLYLYDNRLARVPNLNHNGSLTHLYLQNNIINSMDGVAGLIKLQKLYIGGNKITVIEGLDKLDQLQELHVENQKLPPGEKLLFDPRSIAGITHSLQVLNISGNGLETLRDLQPCGNLTQLVACDNCLRDVKELTQIMGMWRRLWRLELNENPVCQKAKYRDRLIVAAPSLEVFDGKEVTDMARQFLKSWHANKDAVRRRRESATNARGLSEESANIGDTGAYERAVPVGPKGAASGRLGNDMPGYIMPALPRKEFQEVLARSASQPNTAFTGTRPNRTLSDISASTKYMGGSGAYHSQDSSSTLGSAPVQRQLSVVRMGSDYAAGDAVLQ